MKKTSISFGLVNIPVNMNPIIKNNDISFNQLHKKCLSRIKYVKYCPHCKKEVKQADIVKGYEYQNDKYVTLSTEEFNNLKSEDEKTLEIVGFINLNEIDPVYYEKSYIIMPNTKSKSFSLFKDALEKAKKVALAKTVIGTKFYYCVLRFENNNIIMNTLYFMEEVVIPEGVMDAKYTKKELDLALALIKSMDMKFKPEELKDEYNEKVKQALDDKIDGKKVKVPKKKQEKSIKDLMTALEMSLKNV
ncbi:MAG: Ku protein [Ruminococcus sp.]|nr:Ku protein [Ruminococcus sp.]